MLDKNKVIEDLNRAFRRRGYIWQQDNAPSHQKAWKDGLCYKVRSFRGGILWPPYSPDLTPIEHMWAITKELVKGRRFNDEDDLFAAISEAWDSIPLDTVNRLVNSFRARCRVCLELNGGCLNRHWQRVSKLAEQLALGIVH
jgi:transposase